MDRAVIEGARVREDSESARVRVRVGEKVCLSFGDSSAVVGVGLGSGG